MGVCFHMLRAPLLCKLQTESKHSVNSVPHSGSDTDSCITLPQAPIQALGAHLANPWGVNFGAHPSSATLASCA